MSKLEKAIKYRMISRVLEVVFVVLGIVSFIYCLGIAGQSDFNSMTGNDPYTTGWYFVRVIVGVVVFGIATTLAGFFDDLASRWSRVVTKLSRKADNNVD